MAQHHQSCLLCSSTALQPLSKEYAHAYLVKCSACGFVFCSRIPTNDELQNHYAGYPRATAISPVTVKRYEELLEKFEPYRRNNRILDVGCGDGHFLVVAKRKGWEVYGTEFTTDAVNICRAKGIHMHQGSIQSFAPGLEFDVITSFEVLEHINDGREHVTKISSLLRKGGMFYFTTPNFNSLSRRRLGGSWNVIEFPEHLVYYTPRTISKLLSETGFSRQRILTTGFSPQRFRISKGTATTGGNSDEPLRAAIEGNPLLRIAKNSVNTALNVLKIGDTIKGFFVRK
jgi:SAM-dependent methyltransferase